jgi:NAD(P)-dependent dehydrogenase (short-subunit alcohol dehydrogenase family)
VAPEKRNISGVALVTGGARGIGFEVGMQLAERGMTVILGARDPDRSGASAEELAATIPDHGPTGGFFRDGEPLPW